MGIEITLDGATVYHSQFRVCREDSPAFKEYPKQKIRVFYVQGGHTFQKTYRTKQNEKVEGNFWEGAADKNGIVVGLSFANRHQILLNSLHIVDPDQTTTSELDSGMIVRTFPIKQK